MVYVNPTLSQNPLFSMPRGTILSVDNMIDSVDGVWIHVFNNGSVQNTNMKNPAGSGDICWI